MTRSRPLLTALLILLPLLVHAEGFKLEEATIADLHRAITSGEATCKSIVQGYVARARAYNGVCTKLVTKDGKSIPAAKGIMRAGSPLKFPTTTVAAGSVLPDFADYKGLPIEYGRMEATRSDPSAQQQFGMVTGVSNAGGVNALSTLNIRGERSMTCKAKCDAAASSGPLPKTCPAVCEAFRQQPDAIERAAELDKQYGSKPDLEAMPMYCVPFSFKDVYDTTDMRSTGGADVNYAMDAPKQDSTIVSELRTKGAIIYAKANLAEYNAGGGNPGGAAKETMREFGAGARSTWAGTACNPYDTARETGGSSSGSAVSVGANLVMCSICEETGGSCRQPAWRNDVVAVVTTKGLLPYGGAIGADPYLDRAGIQCRTVKDAAKVLDAIKDPKRGYFDPRDIYSALPKALIPKDGYVAAIDSGLIDSKKGGAGVKPLAGMRIGIVREYMVKHAANDRAVSDQVDAEIKRVLRDELGAELVESFDPKYPDDPDVPNMTYTFQQALAEIVPFHMPEYLQTKTGDKPLFTVPGYDVMSRDYMVQAAEGLVPLPEALNIRTVTNSPRTSSLSYHFQQYLIRRGDERVKDLVTLNGNAKYANERMAVSMKNWENTTNMVTAGITQRVKMREAMRMVILKVMQQNNVDVLVNPTSTIPPAKLGDASQPTVNNRPAGRFPTSADLGIPEIVVPAGFNSIMYEPKFALNEAKDNYTSVANETEKSTLAIPLPVGISFWSGIGDEPVVFKVAAAYEAATHHRKAPEAFGKVKGEP
jgi:amidase